MKPINWDEIEDRLWIRARTKVPYGKLVSEADKVALYQDDAHTRLWNRVQMNVWYGVENVIRVFRTYYDAH